MIAGQAPQAASIDVYTCEHGNLHVTLYDRNDCAIASACMDVHQAAGFLESLTSCCEQLATELLKGARRAAH